MCSPENLNFDSLAFKYLDKRILLMAFVSSCWCAVYGEIIYLQIGTTLSYGRKEEELFSDSAGDN
jgi:hypothetical protein